MYVFSQEFRDILNLWFYRFTNNTHECLLPPANEVWGKVIFLHLSVILFTGGGYPGMYTSHSRYTPWAGTPLGRYTRWAGTPPWQVHPQPPSRYTPMQIHPRRYTATPPGRYPPGRYPLAGTPPGQVHPLAGTPPG